MLSSFCTSWNTVAILGVPFHNVTMDETVALIEDQIREGGFHQVATANVDFVQNAMRDRDLRDILCSCDMVVPDGMPIVWMSNLIGTPLKERVSGIDLVERLADVSARRGYSVFLLGASESSSHLAAKVLRQRNPELRIVGRFSPKAQSLERMDHEEILQRIEEARPDILLVAFGNPKQEQWIAMHRNRLQVPVCIGIGGSLDFLAGMTSRAPRWMQRHGMEWLHRTLHEPKRLILRYMRGALCLTRHLPAYMLATAAQPRHRGEARILNRQIGSTKLISIIGDLSSVALDEFNACSRNACNNGMNIVLDMSQAGHLGPESLGSLIHLENRMRQRREQLWLAEIPRHLNRILKTGQLHNYFMTTTMVSDALYRTAKAERRFQASFFPVRSHDQPEAGMMDVRMELLQDVCRRMIATDETEASSLVPSAFASAGN